MLRFIFVLTAAVLLSVTAYADVPKQINRQGVVSVNGEGVKPPASWEGLEGTIPWFDDVRLVSDGASPGPEVEGRWLQPLPWPVVAIHASMLPTGKVLHFSYPGGGPGSLAYLWDPSTGAFENVSMNTDIFCSAQSLLPDGKLYVTGGNDYGCEPQGRFDTHTFDPFTETWTKLEDMTVGRWYPMNVTLGDGRVIIVTGLGRDCATTPVMEMYTPGIGLEVVPGGERELPLFPRMHLLTNGKIAYVGPGPDTRTFDPQNPLWEFVDFSNNWRYEGTSVLVPGEQDTVMIIAGARNNGSVTNTCERIDFSSPSPEWQPTGSLSIPRANANAVILPDRKVMLIGGGAVDKGGEPTRIPEMYDPDTGNWTTLPSQIFTRMYHSTAVLLPDGRVLSAGQDAGVSGSWGEIYEPAYLFRGPRPTISSSPPQVAFGSSFTIDTPDAAAISAVAFIRPSVVTHSGNMEQRYVGLQYSMAAPDQLIATAPTDGNQAPPGFYMLFIVDGDDVPSVAHFVQLVDQGPTCTGNELMRLLCRPLPNGNFSIRVAISQAEPGAVLTVRRDGDPSTDTPMTIGANGTGQVAFRNLPPGTYFFEALECNVDGTRTCP